MDEEPPHVPFKGTVAEVGGEQRVAVARGAHQSPRAALDVDDTGQAQQLHNVHLQAEGQRLQAVHRRRMAGSATPQQTAQLGKLRRAHVFATGEQAEEEHAAGYPRPQGDRQPAQYVLE